MRPKLIAAIVLLVALMGFGAYHFWPDSVEQSSDSQDTTNTGHTVIRAPDESVDDKLVDPKNDSWPAEVAHEEIKKQLKKLGEAIQSGQASKLPAFATETFEASHTPATKSVFSDGAISVNRSDTAPGKQHSSLDSFINRFTGAMRVDLCAFKVVNIDIQPDFVMTNVLVEMRSVDASETSTQLNANWQCRWERSKSPILKSIQVDNFERVEGPASRLFADVTQAVLGNTVDYKEHVLRGIDHWCERIPSIDDMRIFGHHGIAIGDVNGDGLDDVYVCDAGGLPNRLYIRNADGTATDASSSSKTDWLEATTSALLVDLDGDGDRDLVAATVAGIVFAENNGKGVFQPRNAIPSTPEAHSMCAADYDNDRDLDIYICNYGASRGPGSKRGYEATAPVPYNDANNGGANFLLQNNGQFQFKDVAKEVGLDHNNRRFSFAASWEDFDRDGDVDLYVANDFGRNNLYENLNGRFIDIAASANVEDMAGGMSAVWSDVNRDGYADIYVGNMFSAAGNRVTFQRQFTDRHSDASAGMQRMARGNTLFASNGNGTFRDISETAGVTMGRWAWGSRFADLNNDGWDDILVANGYFTNDNSNDL
ncbi:MAG: VCBS repeat-containing protein [Planctomycetales bacterium]|nr:VCBS repeat-containing protein [Planctomycetales bacterium]